MRNQRKPLQRCLYGPMAGSIIPLRPLPATSAPGSSLIGSTQSLPSTLQLLTFSAAGTIMQGSVTFREDAGDDLNHQKGRVEHEQRRCSRCNLTSATCK